MGQDLMQQRRIRESLQLMQDLLTCPAGEEWILLKRHEDVVDADFVQLMEQVATQLHQEGDRHAATFLRNWAAQLHHVLLKEAMPQSLDFQPSPSQLALIQQLLDAEPEEVEPLLVQSQDLVRPELVQAIHHIAQQQLQRGKTKTAQQLEQLAFRANQAWIQNHLAPAASATTVPSSPNREGEAESDPRLDPAESNSNVERSAETSAETSSASAPSVAQAPLENAVLNSPEQSAEPRSPVSPQSVFPSRAASLEKPQAYAAPDPWQGDSAPLSSALQLKVPQQIANGLHEVTLLLHTLNKSIAAQTAAIQTLTQTTKNGIDHDSSAPINPLWYMDVLERAHSSDWIISTDELTHLIGVRPQCHGDETYYVRGCWKFEKVGKLGSQTGWRVHKR